MNHRVIGDLPVERLELSSSGQLPFKQQVRYFKKIAVFCQLLNRITAVTQYAFATVDKRDLARTTCRGRKTRIVSEITKRRRQCLDLQCRLPLGTLDNRQFKTLASTLVCNDHAIIGHGALLQNLQVSRMRIG